MIKAKIIKKDIRGYELVSILKQKGFNTKAFENIFYLNKIYNLYKMDNEYVINIDYIFYNISKEAL